MKNGIGVQKTVLEYFDNRKPLNKPSWVSPGLDKFINNSLCFNIHGSTSIAKIVFHQK